MKALKFTILFLLFFLFKTQAQSTLSYELSLVPVNIPNLPGLHSYAFAQHDGKWLIIGGRRDGLHARQPFNAFAAAQNNTDIYVIDVDSLDFWTSSVSSLATSISEQLQSTNMNFYQDEDSLYIIGGYGFSVTVNNHITYPNLTSVDVPGLINAVINNQNINPFFKQIQNNVFAVTGGHLKKLKNQFYLVGGHRFDGRYNPMGNPTFTQAYTNQIRKFNIDNSGTQLSYNNYSEITDAVHLHRRDYNLLPQIFPNGEEGMMISSGVFQTTADLPFLYPVEIRDTSYTPITAFNQYLSNYHSAVANLYDSVANNMHSIFFGGMSQYYYQNGSLVQDNLVPFVKTISRLSRDASGNLSEHQLTLEMPSLKGAGAEFFPNLDLPHYHSKIIKLNDITANTFKIGHIFGGINSTALNPFSANQTNLTNADNTIYEVWLNLNPTNTNFYNIDGKNPYEIEIYPNPFKEDFYISFDLNKSTKVAYMITNQLGQLIQESEEMDIEKGKYKIDINLKEKSNPAAITVIFDNKYYVTKKLKQE